jgi:hypothetical protein
MNGDGLGQLRRKLAYNEVEWSYTHLRLDHRY